MREGEIVDGAIMGSRDDAKAELVRLTREWRRLRQPLMANAAAHKKRELDERETRFQLANAALLWLWHEEHADAALARPETLT